MGRKALPANVHVLRGNPSKKPLSELLGELQPVVEIPGCPRHLLPEARKEWKRITVELERYGLISKLDRATLSLYCQAWARWVWAEEQLQRAQQLAATKMAEAAAQGKAYEGGDGLTIPTPNGHLAYSPHWVISNKAAEQVYRFREAFGLGPDVRGKVQTSDNRQSALPGMDPEDRVPRGGFDDI